MSHDQRGSVTHIRVTSIKMTRLIFDTKKYGGTSRIDVIADVHMKLSRAKGLV
jgi:hypothetical protein